jgi:hypothetical protein
MITAEQFIYALFDKGGYKLYKSPLVDKLLNTKSVYQLCHIGDKLQGNAVIQMWWPTEHVITVSNIVPMQLDQYNRKGVWNHTVLMKVEDYFQLAKPGGLLAHLLLSPFSEAPKTPLKPLEVKPSV